MASRSTREEKKSEESLPCAGGIREIPVPNSRGRGTRMSSTIHRTHKCLVARSHPYHRRLHESRLISRLLFVRCHAKSDQQSKQSGMAKDWSNRVQYSAFVHNICKLPVHFAKIEMNCRGSISFIWRFCEWSFNRLSRKSEVLKSMIRRSTHKALTNPTEVYHEITISVEFAWRQELICVSGNERQVYDNKRVEVSWYLWSHRCTIWYYLYYFL